MEEPRFSREKLDLIKLSNVDSLQMMFNLQERLQTRLYGIKPEQLEKEARIGYLTVMLEAAMAELHEAKNWLPWKPWKKQQSMELEELKWELIDCMHFIVNAYMAAGGTAEEFRAMFVRKNQINHERQDRGY